VRNCTAAQLQRCQEEGQIRVQCFAPDCKKIIPLKLVYHVSASARGLALEIDKQNDRLHTVYKEGEIEWFPTLCPICSDYTGPLLKIGTCGHSACECCWQQWAESQLSQCYLQRHLKLPCVGEGCAAIASDKMACFVSQGMQDLKRLLAKRSKLQDNKLYPREVQMDCPRPTCVGLGYLGFDTVMCFLCEHQWPADTGKSAYEELDPESYRLKQCPRCAEHIEKNGGCDHMTCRCGYQFWWSTLKPYQLNSTT